MAASAARLHEVAVREVVFRIPHAPRVLDSNEVTVGNAARNLERLGIVTETTRRPRNKRFVYSEYLRVIEEGTEQVDVRFASASTATSRPSASSSSARK